MSVTRNIAKYIEDAGINLSDLSRKSGVDYTMLCASLGNGRKQRELRADELTSICSVLRINPMDFADRTVMCRNEIK